MQSNHPLKWKSLQFFKETNESVPSSCNKVKQVRHIQKSDKIGYWKVYSRNYEDNVSNCHPYELDAISSDLYRFILGMSRAAKVCVLFDESTQKKEGSISYLNSQGFTEANELWKKYKKHYFWGERAEMAKLDRPKKIEGLPEEIFNTLTKEQKEKYVQKGIYVYPLPPGDPDSFSYEDEKAAEAQNVFANITETVNKYLYRDVLTPVNGMAEMEMAIGMLNDKDNASHNFGLNNQDEISKIDYDWTLNDIMKRFFKFREFERTKFHEISSMSIDELFKSREEKISDNPVLAKRFYICQFRSLLLGNNNIITAICKRHTASNELTNQVQTLMEEQTRKLNSNLMNSNGFKAFIKDITFEELKDHFDTFFYHEKKHLSPDCTDLMSIIQEEFKNIQEKTKMVIFTP